MKNLIEKYFAGKTSNEEEQEILQYFLSDSIDPELEQDKDYFLGLAYLKAHAKEIIPEADFTFNEDDTVEEILRRIDKIEIYPSRRRFLGLRVKPAMMKRIAIALAVAASFALLIMLFPFWNTDPSFAVLCGNTYHNNKQVKGTLLASLEDVRFETEQMFNNSDNNFYNLKNLMI